MQSGERYLSSARRFFACAALLAAAAMNALAALLDKIGPAVVIVHSQSGIPGLDLVHKPANLVRGLITVEGGCDNFTAVAATR